jgi:hypothetical protein
MFEIENTLPTPIRIDDLGQAFSSSNTSAASVYTLEGSCVGKTTNASQWTLLSTNNTVQHGAWPSQDRLHININVTLQPAQVQSFYIHLPDCRIQWGLGKDHCATILQGSNLQGKVYASNNAIRVVAREMASQLFGTTSRDRQWQGAVYYCPLNSTCPCTTL